MNKPAQALQLIPETLEIQPDLSERIRQPQACPSDDAIGADMLESLLRQRFDKPVDFPPVYQAVIPGDQVVIAVAPQTTCGFPIAMAAARLLVEQGMNATDITLAMAREDRSDHGDALEDMTVIVFDPDDSTQRAYLMAGADGQPVYISRLLFDADVVIPVGSFFGAIPRDTICPAFCDRETRNWLSGLAGEMADATVNMINEQLGSFWQINVIDAPGARPVDLLVGSRRQVLLENLQRAGEHWRIGVPGECQLAMVTLESDADQSWENAAAALLTADRMANRDGDIALITRITDRPPGDWGESALIRELLGRRHVYLYSLAGRTSVESCGFAPVENAGELDRLVRQYEHVSLVRDGHKTVLQPAAGKTRPR